MGGRQRRVTYFALFVVVAAAGGARRTGADILVHGRAAQFIEPLGEPSAVATGSDGSIFVCEALKHRVSVFDATGTLIRRWGSFGRGDGEFDGPRGVAVGEDGRVYVADSGNDRIQVFTADGRFETQWGRHGSDAGEFDEPLGLAVRGDRVLVADSRNDRVQIFRRDGAFVFYVWSYGSHDGAFDRPVDVAVATDGVFYVSDQGNSRVQEFSPDGRFVLAWGGRGRRGGVLIEPGGLDERAGRVVVADPDTHRLVEFDRSGALLGEWSASGEDGSRRIDAPGSVAFLPAMDEIVICSAIEDRCQIVSARLDLVPTADDVGRRIARDGYAIGGSGDAIVIASRETGRPFIVDLTRRTPAVLGTLGGPGREPLEFIRPQGFLLDLRAGTVLISDGGNARLQRLRLRHPPGERHLFDPALTKFINGIGFDDQERLDVEPGNWGLLPATFEPGAIVRDARRRLLIADTVGRRIVVLDDEFRFAGSWGGFGGEDGRFREITGLAIDGARSSLYVLDAGRRRVQAFDLDGHLRSAWGEPGDGPGKFIAPSGIAVGRDGSVYVVDRGANRVQRFGSRGTTLATWGSGGAGDGQFRRPEAIHVDRHGRVIVIDSGNRRAQAFTAGGRFLWEMSLDPAAIAAPRVPQVKPVRSAGPTHKRGAEGCRMSMASNDGRYTVCATSVPNPIPLNEPFAMNVQVYETPERTRLARKVILEVDATMPEHHHGMNLKPQVRAIGGPTVQDVMPGHGAMGDGHFEVQGMLFHMPGRWEIHFDITRGAITERAQLEIDLD